MHTKGLKEISLLPEEYANAIRSKFLAILQQEALMDALFRIGRLTIPLRVECLHQKGIRRTGNVDISMCLDKFKRLLIIAKRQFGECLKTRGHLG